MTVNAVQDTDLIKQNIDIQDVQTNSVPLKQEENISEILAGNSGQQVEKEQGEQSGGRLGAIIFMLSSFALVTFMCTKRGDKFLSKYIFAPLEKVLNKGVKNKNVKRLKTLRLNRDSFNKVKFEKSNDIAGLRKMGDKLGIKVKIKRQKSGDIEKMNSILSVLADAKNESKGRLVMPKKVCLEDLVPTTAGITFNGKSISINRTTSDIEFTTCHELGHVNHYPRTIDYRSMRDIETIEKVYGDTTLMKDFLNNEQLQADIKKYIGEYAASSPCEFVADTFACLLGGRKLPQSIMQQYAKYKGPVRLPVIRNFLRNL